MRLPMRTTSTTTSSRLFARSLPSVAFVSRDEADETDLDLSFDPVAAGVPDSLTLLMNDVGRWPLLTAARKWSSRSGSSAATAKRRSA